MRALILALLVACGSSSPATSTTPEPVADPVQVVDALLGESPAAAWSASQQRAIYPLSYQEEGAGAGLSIVIVGTGVADETVEVYTPGQDPAERVAAARPALVERVTGQGYVLMQYTPWPDGAASVSVPGGPSLAWDGTALAASGKTLTTLPPEPPHQVRPRGVFSLPGTTTLLFTYVMDPGESYVEGYNMFSGARVLAL